MSIGIDEDVVGLEVTMHDREGVQGREDVDLYAPAVESSFYHINQETYNLGSISQH